jgi:formate-dependent nitrite reductase membrane component NrfD
MSLFVADPTWGWWIVLYFFLGGIAAGCYFVATFVDLFGREGDRRVSSIGFALAFPLISLCGIFLIVDLEQPERFWHMLFQSEVVDEALADGWPWSASAWEPMLEAPMLKYWSPMSIGAWALGLFGVCSGLSFAGNLLPNTRPWRWLRLPWIRWPFELLGCGIGFFVAAYTGALLTATNQPLWSQSEWIAALFLISAASAGLATLMLGARLRGDVGDETMARLERADLWAVGLELIVFLIFVGSLSVALGPVCETMPGLALVGGTLILGLLLPLAVHLQRGPTKSRATVVALATLAGGFLLRWGIVVTPPEMLARVAAGPFDLWEQSSWSTAHGKVFLAATVLLALLVPYLFARRLGWSPAQKLCSMAVSLVVIAVVSFYTVTPAAQLREWRSVRLVEFSPENGRPRGGGVGASISNRGKNLRPRGKFEAMVAR